MTRILLDMNGKEFQNSLFQLEKQEQRALLNTLRKITKSNWEDLYQDKGINWELITSQKTKKGQDIYSWLCFFTPSFPIFSKFRRNDSFEASLMKSFY